MKPWEIHRALTEERLRAVGRLIWDARVSAADDAKWELGDNLWDIGCKAFSRTCGAIGRAAMSKEYPYLSIRDRSKHLVLAIGSVPARLYRGDADGEAPERYATPDVQELNDLNFAFELFDTPTPNAIFRFIVETDAKGFPTAIYLAQVERDGSIINPWRIDLGGATARPLTPDPVTPPPAPLRDERDERAREAAEAAKKAKDKKGDIKGA